MKVFATVLMAAAVGVLGAVPSYGAVITEGSVLPNYAVVSVGPNASFNINSGPLTGAVLVGDGSTTSSAGGGNGAITGGVFTDNATLGANLQHIQTSPTVTLVSSTVTQQAFTDANTLAAAATAAGLTPNSTFASINGGTQTFNAAGALTVIDVGSIQNAKLTFSGTASDFFVVNISGSYQTNVVNSLTGGVTAANILFNFTGTSGNIFQTSGGDLLQGTFLATKGGDFQFSNLDLTGQLINTDGLIQDVSGSGISQSVPFSGGGVPEPASLSLLGLGAIGLLARRRRMA